MRMFGFVLSAVVLIISTLIITPSFAQNFSGHTSSLATAHAQMLQESNTFMTLHHMKTRAVEMAASDLSCKTSADCAQFGIGYQICGGSPRFVLTSRSNARFQDLAVLTEDIVELEQSAIQQFGRTPSTCTNEPKPAFECVRSVCQVK